MLTLLSVVALFGVLPLAASGTPVANATAGASSTHGVGSSARVIRYVSLGDSVTSVSPSFVDIVAKRAGVALHRKVVVSRFVEEGTVAHLHARIKSTAELRDAIRSADLITISLGVNQIARAAYQMTPNGCGSKDGSACIRTAEKAFEKSYGALLTQLTQLRPASKTAFRLLTAYNIPGVFHSATAVAFTAALRAENRYVRAQAPHRGMKCADVFAAFNGADGSRDPRATGLIVPDGHPSAKGSATIAKVVLATGFSPLH